jgi:hypothetical protein
VELACRALTLRLQGSLTPFGIKRKSFLRN